MKLVIGCGVIVLIGLLAQGAGAADKLPSNKWYQGVRGLQEARAFQKTTNADLIVYFARYNSSDEKGLCRWWEKSGMNDPTVSKFLRDYIKVQIVTPVSSKEEKDIVEFKFNSCPAIFVVKTNGWPQRCQTFDWTGGKPDPLPPAALIKLFREKSSPRYQEPADAQKKP